ncbi:putative transposon, En/Spm-like protein [Tanacetum coccineum]|uniref:Transposon, En/Spm-like protein n=1 Tax=Tanacetum coccineum TaxID=301880 RepID=A0ABQ5CC35_9ASTR
MNHIPPETTSSCHPSPQQLPRHLTTNPVTHKQLSSRHAPRKFACHYHRHRPTTFRHPLIQELLLDTENPLYEGCPDFTKLSAIVKLLNLKGKYGASDKFFTELLGLIKKMLPAGNEMVEKTYQAKKVMRLMGSGYKKIHVCINNCLLYWKNDKDLTACRTCGTSRWKVDNKTKKVYENIPAKAWRTIDEKFLEIAEDTRNLRLGISADGVDVNMGNRHHSVWPVLTVIYNLPPWLWVDTYDASTKDNFNLRAVVLWTINDYPALGTLCGCPYSGFKGYVMISTIKPHPFRKQKKAFNGQQEFLQAPIPMTGEQIYNEVKHIENKWGKGKRTNNNASENQEDTRGRGGKIQKQKRNTTEEEGSSSQVNGQNGVYWKKFNIWYRKLKYWRHNPVPHCIDFMHVEKNVAESIVGTLLHVLGKTKDGLNARLDLAELGVKPELFAMQDKDKTTLPPAGYTLTNVGKDIFCETLHNIKNIPFRQIPLFKCDWLNHKSGGVKRDKLGYTLVDLNNLGHTVDPLDKKLSIVFKTPPKNYKDTYDEVDEEFSTVIHHCNDNVLPLVDQRDLANESRDDYYRKDCGGVMIRKYSCE